MRRVSGSSPRLNRWRWTMCRPMTAAGPATGYPDHAACPADAPPGLPVEDSSRPGIARRWTRLAGWVAVPLVATACASLVTVVPDDFATDVPEGLAPIARMEPAAAADVVRRYLATQEGAAGGGGQHRPADITSVKLVRASDAPLWVDGVPAAAATDPGQLVWIVTGGGDFLNPSALPWSTPGKGGACGTAIVDDGTAALLGVFPAAEGSTCPR